MEQRTWTEREIAVGWLALYTHPDVLDLEAIDAQWYADPDNDYRRPLTAADREAARLWLFVHTAGPVLERIGEVFRAMAEQLSKAMAEVGKALAAIRTSLVEAGMVPDQPPSDPKARALHLVKHRNTGPKVHADARRNRR